MKLVPRKCLKCGTEIISTGNEIKHNWVQYFFKLSTGNNVCIAFCKTCEITKDDFEGIEKALDYTDDKKVIGIIKRQTAKDICMEKQNSKCFMCGKDIKDLNDCELSVGGFVRHYSCPVEGHREELPSAGKIAKEYRERNKRVNVQ
jgi:hypothetical protein